MAPEFNGKSSHLVVAENWVMEMEKSFKPFEVLEVMKMPLAKFQLKETANDWWMNVKANQQVPMIQEGFKVLFYNKYFPQSTRDKVLSQLLPLKQRNRSVEDQKVEFNCLIKFTLEGIKNSKRTKIQKF